MLKLTLLRHAKSSWDYSGLDDFLRPLNERGYRQAVDMDEYFPEDVDVIWCSPAVRAYTTVHCMLIGQPEMKSRLVLKKEIYEANANTLLELLRDGDKLKHIALVGHNPGFEELASLLTGSEVRIKTAHNALFEIECENWKEIKAGTARLLRLERPKV